MAWLFPVGNCPLVMSVEIQELQGIILDHCRRRAGKRSSGKWCKAVQARADFIAEKLLEQLKGSAPVRHFLPGQSADYIKQNPHTFSADDVNSVEGIAYCVVSLNNPEHAIAARLQPDGNVHIANQRFNFPNELACYVFWAYLTGEDAEVDAWG